MKYANPELQGAAAYKNNQTLDANPFTEGTLFSDSWVDGWMDAQREYNFARREFCLNTGTDMYSHDD